MSDPISCPVCQVTAEPAAQLGAIAVCRACGASLHVDASGIRRATFADTTALGKADLSTLQHARAQIARPERR